MGLFRFRLSHRGLIVPLVAVGSLLAGCSSTPSMSSLTSLFGSKSAAADANASATPTANPPPDDFNCPPVQVRQGAATLSSSVNPAEPTAMNLRYQVTIGTTARECHVNGNTVSVKVGMQGRVILGPQGSPGVVSVPIRYAVVRETVDSKVFATKLDRIQVTVPPDDSNVLFTHVTEGLEFPLPKGAEIDSYVIYIGFDPQAQEPEHRKKAPSRRRAAAR